MFVTTMAVALTLLGRVDEGLDSRACFALFERNASLPKDISFLYEGRIDDKALDPDADEVDSKFQGFYAYRSDGASLLDVYFLNSADQPDKRIVYGVIDYNLSILDATPDQLPRVRARDPVVSPGGPGSLNLTYSAQRLHLAWFFSNLGAHDDHDYHYLGKEEVDGVQCDVVTMLRLPKSRHVNWEGPVLRVKLWLDRGRGGVVVRMDSFEGERLSHSASFTNFHELRLGDAGSVYIPLSGVDTSYSLPKLDRGKPVFSDSPASIAYFRILKDTIKINRGFKDAFFSVKDHALASSEEEVRALSARLESRYPNPKKPKVVAPPPPVDPQLWLDEALAEADRQASQLDASAAASRERLWSTLSTWLVGGASLVVLAVAAAYRWGGRA